MSATSEPGCIRASRRQPARRGLRGRGAGRRSSARIDTGKPRASSPLPGHYASVLRLDERTGIAFGDRRRRHEDGRRRAARALRDDRDRLRRDERQRPDLRRRGADRDGRLHPLRERRPRGLRRDRRRAAPRSRARRDRDPRRRDRPGRRRGLRLGAGRQRDRPRRARRDRRRRAVEPGDAIIGLPSSGLHSNGYTLARRALADVPLDDDAARPPARRRPARADRDLRARRARAARLRRRRPRPRPHHRRRAQQPASASPRRSATRSTTRFRCRRSSS